MSDEDTKHWIYAGGLPYELTEGDVICVFSQYGEILQFSFARDKETGKSRGFGFLKYEDSRSCELAVDNLDGAVIVGRKIKVSFANNTNAIKTIKPAVVAPQDGSMPIIESTEDRKEKDKRRSSRSPELERKRHTQSSTDRSYNKHRRHDQDTKGDKRHCEDKHARYDRHHRHREDDSSSRRHDRNRRHEREDRRSTSPLPGRTDRSHHHKHKRSRHSSDDSDRDYKHSHRHKHSSKSHRSLSDRSLRSPDKDRKARSSHSDKSHKKHKHHRGNS